MFRRKDTDLMAKLCKLALHHLFSAETLKFMTTCVTRIACESFGRATGASSSWMAALRVQYCKLLSLPKFKMSTLSNWISESKISFVIATNCEQVAHGMIAPT